MSSSERATAPLWDAPLRPRRERLRINIHDVGDEAGFHPKDELLAGVVDETVVCVVPEELEFPGQVVVFFTVHVRKGRVDALEEVHFLVEVFLDVFEKRLEGIVQDGGFLAPGDDLEKNVGEFEQLPVLGVDEIITGQVIFAPLESRHALGPLRNRAHWSR